MAEKFTQPNFETEIDSFYHRTSIKRHNPAYYKTLCQLKLFLAFGGYYEFKPMRYLPYTFIDKVLRKPAYWRYKKLKSKERDFSDQVFIFQHDNFRFWEVLYSGSIAINLNMEYWNFILPVMPVSGKHYIGIEKLKNNNMEATLSALAKTDFENISSNGRTWVLENYSPRAQANRVLAYL